MDNTSNQPVKIRQLRRLGNDATVVFAAFLLGFVPMWLVARTFYTNLQAELDRPQSVYAGSPREAMLSLLAQRDQMITLLARGDPAAADRLADAYMSYRQAAETLPRAGSAR